MNVHTLLVTPWRCGQQSLRWLSAGLLVLALGAAIAMGMLSSKPDWPITSALILCFGLVYVWIFHFSSAFLLALGARNLRIPGVGATVVASLVLYGVLSVVPATLVLGLLGGYMLNIGAMLLLCVLVGLAFALLPRYLAMWIGFMPAITIGLRKYVQIPGPGSAAFSHWALPVALFLLIVVTVRWRSLLLADNPRTRGLRSAVVMRFQKSDGWNGLWGTGCSGLDKDRNRPDWMQSGVDLRKVDSRRPAHALRVAMGNLFVPRTAAGHLRNHGLTLLSLLLLIPALLLLLQGGHDASSIVQGFLVGIVGWLGVFGAMMLVSIGSYQLRNRWSRANSELPLLALMPGLGSPDDAKRHLLRASLGLPLLGLLGLMSMVLLAAWQLDIRGLGLVAVAMSQIGPAIVLLALGLDVLGGHPLRLWMQRVLSIVMVLLISGSLFLPLSRLGRHPFAHENAVMVAILGAWALFILGMALIGWRGWVAFRQRPHAFLPLDIATA